MADEKVILHISGPDKPGVTSTLIQLIHQEKAELIDIGQSVLHNYLNLSAIVKIPSNSALIQKTMMSISQLGLRVDISHFTPPSNENSDKNLITSLCITIIGDLSNGYVLTEATRHIASRYLNIRDIKTLSRGHLHGIELTVDLPPARHLTTSELSQIRQEVLTLANRLNVDVSIQVDDVFRRSKRLVCFDVDSTFIQMEVIDELAALAGCKDEVAKITESAMRGEINFKSALEKRVSLLKGLPMEKARKLLDNVLLSPGVEPLVKTLKSMGFRVGLVSGGFDFFVNELKKRYHLDFAFANELEVFEGKLTGKVLGSIVDSERKAQILRDMTQVYKCRLEQTIAVGDGANDVEMLKVAGLGIAYRGKPVLQKIADTSLNNTNMNSLFYLMGFTHREIDTLS